MSRKCGVVNDAICDFVAVLETVESFEAFEVQLAICIGSAWCESLWHVQSICKGWSRENSSNLDTVG